MEALQQVGLADQIHKKPNQMSGGQMQRVAIARALVNNPDILLADEPTGALDSETSIQIMDLLQEVAKDRLVIMVTHNPELAKHYSTRIIQLFDGSITHDSNPYEEKTSIVETAKNKLRYTSMSLKTALSLSMNNLMTKKARTFLTAFAGSIGIIGIALILSLSNGVQGYIKGIEKDTLSSYPITIEDNSMDMSVMMETMMNMNEAGETYNDDDIHSRQMINDILETMSNKAEKNNLAAFKKHIEENETQFNELMKAVEYDYKLSLNIYNEHGKAGLVQVSPNQFMNTLGLGSAQNAMGNIMPGGQAALMANEVWTKLPNSNTMKDEQYEMMDGRWPEKYNEVVLEIDKNKEINDYVLYSLGLLDQQKVKDNFDKMQRHESITKDEATSYTKEKLLNMKFKLILNTDYYKNVHGTWIDMQDDENFMKEIVKKGEEIKVVGIVQPKDGAMAKKPMQGGILYTDDLQKHVIEKVSSTDIVKDQNTRKDINIFTGVKFNEHKKLSMNDLTKEQQAMMANLSQAELSQYITTYNDNLNATYDSNLMKLGAIDLNSPNSISLYAKSFDDKEKVADLINTYNEDMKASDQQANVISYNDIVGMMMESVTSIIDMISYVLIAFVSVSLIVSSIMIGIITYISVLERTKEIGILRSIGASKKDISHVFNAETFIVGLISGCLGVGITVLLNIPISFIVKNITGINGIASLPWIGGIILILISLCLTTIAGLIPSRIAAKKDPVEALRTE